MDKVSFIGIGAQKCASSWLYRILADHPEVFVSTPKELDFFSNYYARGFQWYHRHFDGQLAAKKCGEISPSYFHNVMVPERVRNYRSDVRILLSLRDPIRRAYSNHLHMIKTGLYTGPDFSFEAGLENNPTYLYQSLYATHLRRWLEYFPTDQICILVQEEIDIDPLAHARKVYGFVGVDPGFQSPFVFQKGNPSYGEKVRGVDGTLQVIGKAGRAVGLGGWVTRARESNFVRGLKSMNHQHMSQTVPAMSEETKTRLLEYFSGEMQEFFTLLGRRPADWETYVS